MNLRLSPWITLGLLLFGVLPIQAVQQPATNQGGQSQQPQPNSDARSVVSPRDMQIERAKIQMAEKRYEEAIKTYQELLKSDPKNAVFLNMVGIAYLDLSNFDQAKK